MRIMKQFHVFRNSFIVIKAHIHKSMFNEQLDNINVLVDSKYLLTGLSKPSLGVVFLLSYVS